MFDILTSCIMYSFSYLWAKLIKKIRGAAIIGSNIDKTSVIESGSHIVGSSFGRYSYCGYDCQIINTIIGNFCCLSDNIIIGGAKHPMDWACMSPVFFAGRDSIRKKFSEFERPSDLHTEIGNDVWIGNGVIIIQGVRIGNGAVIGAGAVVTKDVEPYSIVVGNPARMIRKRFDCETIEMLEKSQWWLRNDDDIDVSAQYIRNPQQFVKSFKR